MMYLSFNNGKEGWQFPVLPGSISIARGGASKDYDIVGTGKISVIGKPELAEISFESFFPAQHYPFNSTLAKTGADGKTRLTSDSAIVHTLKETGLPDPNGYVDDINRWMRSGHPVRFIYVGSNATDDSAVINLPMTIASFERREEAGSPGDIYYSLKLREYAFYAAKQAKTVKQADGTTKRVEEPAKRPDERVRPATYTLKAGDTLIVVARKLLGDSSRWREIQKLNGITDSQTRQLAVGKVLQLPKGR
ncbi:LysM peptidoglycan-binding domain-containing protein [Paenibacillus sp. T1]|uniref:LysM peptidoglycan-binding domain-containing protein n=2 Tax=Paenibacillus glycinis TaxID=2697035 RepID=A0ABW9XNW7_9BACL|nr:LysM peptidoglycan-binding domain-containing protein [Paenibacillus glycinis]